MESTNRDQAHVNPSPHPDGGREGVINDPKAHKMGIATDSQQPGFKFSQNPYHVSDKSDTPEEMEEFEQMTRGKKLDEI